MLFMMGSSCTPCALAIGLQWQWKFPGKHANNDDDDDDDNDIKLFTAVMGSVDAGQSSLVGVLAHGIDKRLLLDVSSIPVLCALHD